MGENKAKCIQLSWRQCQQNAWRKASCTFFMINVSASSQLLAQRCKWSWVSNAMESGMSLLCAFVFILIVSLKYIPRCMVDVRSQFAYVQYKQEVAVAMQLYIQNSGSLLSGVLKENVRKSASKNSGSADRWILWCFEYGLWLEDVLQVYMNFLQDLKNLFWPMLWSHQERLCKCLTRYKEISHLSMEFTV